jgi:hypothetical protein
MNDYSQGICENGAAILKDGLPMTIEQILIELRGAQQLSAVTTEAWVLRQKADAIDEASRMCMPSRWGNIDLAPKGFQEYCDGVKSVCAYADSLRAYANKLEKL